MDDGGDSGHEFTEHEENPHYLDELTAEKQNIRPEFVHASHWLEEEISRVQTGAHTKKDSANPEYLEVHSGKKVKLSTKILIPIKEYPKFNFVGKLLGPRGNSLKRLQEESGTRLAVLGKGSVRDKNKEQEQLTSGDPKYSHLREELHVRVDAYGTAAEAYMKLSHATAMITKYLIPDYNDDIRQQQLEELTLLADGSPAPPHMGGGGGGGHMSRGGRMPPRDRDNRGRPPMSRGGRDPGGMPPRGGGMRGGSGRGMGRPMPSYSPVPKPRDYGYDGGYDDNASYEDHYSAPPPPPPPRYDDNYGGGYDAEGGDSYGSNGSWGGSGGNGRPYKAPPPSRHSMQSGRPHPYSR